VFPSASIKVLVDCDTVTQRIVLARTGHCLARWPREICVSMKSVLMEAILTPYTILIGVLIVASVAISPPLSPVTWVTGDRMDWASRKLAGWDARNCGHVPADGDAREASTCVLSAFREKRSFRVRYDLVGVDAGPTVSLVWAPDGHIYRLFFLSHPVGGPIFGTSVHVKRCQEPVVFEKLTDVSIVDRGMITCHPELD
jgi:hypothetical protein